jgi:LacI family transcriptional regulator
MAEKTKASPPKEKDPPRGGVSLKQLAKHLKLSTTTLSLVLNDAPSAGSIPQETKDRIFAAAKELNYRPNYLARSLRFQRTHTCGVIVPELSDGYSAMVLNGVESVLSGEGYLYLTASHLHRTDLVSGLPRMLAERQVEGLIAVDTPIRTAPNLPTVTVSGRNKVEGVTNVILNHGRAAELGIGHLYELGHRAIAVIIGQEFSSDTDVRWSTIQAAAHKRGIDIDPRLTAQLKGDSPSPELGYEAAKSILSSGILFTALFAFNDISAIGAIRAFQEAGLKVPEEISVLGFDDIYAAAFHNPPLTTIRQPLFEMGRLAAQTLLAALREGLDVDSPAVITAEPELIVRESTGPARADKFAKV